MKHDFEECLQQAKEMYAFGHDNKYIEFQLAEKGVPDDTIDEVVLAVKKLRKEGRKKSGLKQLLYGISIIAVAILFTFLSFNSESPVVYVLWGMAVTGLVIFLKGVANVMDL